MLRTSFAKQGVMAHIGAQMGAVSPGYCEIKLPYSDDVSQQHGFFHGGIVGTIADSAGGYAAFSLMGEGEGILTVEYKLNLMAPADGDMLIARGEVVRPGRSLSVCRADVVVVKDGVETACAVMQQTLMRIVGRTDVSG
ncbi:MAG: PaaI family thioesterase [Rhodospirillaceae bacterium]|nr:PaaI family thioesterase [Rhodospirillaceae bacterium]